MSIYEFFKNLSLSGWTSLIVIMCMLIEITPVKINPIGWLGKHLNADMYSRVNKIEAKLDNHIAESYRNYILNFQRELLNDRYTQFTYEEWKKAITSCQDYEKYCQENKIDNNVVSMAIDFIESEYKKAQENHTIINLPSPRV